MPGTSLRPVVALDLDGVVRIPNAQPGAEFRAAAREVPVTMFRTAFPSYSRDEPVCDDDGSWT